MEKKVRLSAEKSDQYIAKILCALESEPYLCIHSLIIKTQIPYKLILGFLAHMKTEGMIDKIGMPEAPEQPVWTLIRRKTDNRTDEVTSTQVAASSTISPIVGLTHSEAIGRIIMLKRMKARLINEWHPIIDKLLGDYERDIARLEIKMEAEGDVD